MNILEPWNIVFLICFIVYFRIRHIFILQTKNEEKTVSHFDRSEKILLAAMFPGVVLLPLLYLFTPLLNFADYRLPSVIPWIGMALMIFSLWLFWKSHADLGQNWSVSIELRDGHNLVTNGVYQKIRHPMYASIWLWAIAQGMILENWLAGWAVVPAFAAMYFMRIPREEGMMIESFGDEYRAYMKTSGRIVPRMKPASSDEC